MTEPMTKLEIIARSEVALLQINARRMANRSALFSIALVFLMLGLAMMTLAVYSAMEPSIGAPLAALTVSVIDTLIGLLFIFTARRAGPSDNEEKLAREIRDMAYAELEKDLHIIKTEVGQITSDINRIRTGFTSLTSGSVSILGPVVSMLLNLAKKD